MERQQLVKKVIKEAGSIAAKYFSDYQNIQKKVKTTSHDIVTVADQEVEKFISAEISQYFNDDGFLGEEHGITEGRNHSYWVVDPIDGTANFARGIAYYSISIAYVCDNRISLGAVYDPSTDELYFAEYGRGAYLNEQKISVAEVSWNHALIALGRSDRYESAKHWDAIPRILDSGAEYRRFGSAALSLAQVGAGKLNAYYEPHLYPWDAMAGLLIASEAGAVTTPYIDTGGPNACTNWRDGREVLAATKSIWTQLQTILT